MEKCAKDPVVEAAVAQLMTSECFPRAICAVKLFTPVISVLSTTMGILGCFSTAFWGAVSDVI